MGNGSMSHAAGVFWSWEVKGGAAGLRAADLQGPELFSDTRHERNVPPETPTPEACHSNRGLIHGISINQTAAGLSDAVPDRCRMFTCKRGELAAHDFILFSKAPQSSCFNGGVAHPHLLRNRIHWNLTHALKGSWWSPAQNWFINTLFGPSKQTSSHSAIFLLWLRLFWSVHIRPGLSSRGGRLCPLTLVCLFPSFKSYNIRHC